MSTTTRSAYPWLFLAPAALVYGGLFLLPTLISLFFSMTRWTLTAWYFTGLDNFASFFTEPSLSIGFTNTVLYAAITCGLKVVLGLLLGVLLSSSMRARGFLRSMVFFPNLISTIAVGITFSSLMHPSRGVINQALAALGIPGPDWLGNVHLALVSVALVDVWKGVGVATVIYIAGIVSIPPQYYEALQMDGGNAAQKFRWVTLPLVRPAMNAVVILAFIGGLRTFDLVWAMTRGGPGFTTDLIASIIYKQYTGGFYGLATAGNVILFAVVSFLAVPLYRWLTRHEVDL
ncbi:MAG TPA: sugar ABC transporter permease [Spirochaetia bacterium]|nr:sugar ABC transporter permease [Spirochaetia bacterium]